MVQWFRRFAEVPGVEYTSNSGINRFQLPGHDAVPHVGAYSMLNSPHEQHEFLSWPMVDNTVGTTSASPAKQWKTQTHIAESDVQTRLRQLYETLELPGELSDYHFAIQGCCSELWRLHRLQPWVLEELERLCWLDIRLVQNHPDFTVVNNEKGHFWITTFDTLLQLYEQEGYLYEALQVAEIAERFNQQHEVLERIKARIASLEAEEVS
ncbi:MAG TPA: hypothetical protein VNG51_01240 [Ktedonobacteraceae bacterium]|nr:hypothetical protein [Ktedonobacteraceae bacterium]